MNDYQSKMCFKCSKEADTTLILKDGKELKLCKSCALKNILKNILVASIIPILLFLLLLFIGTTLLQNQPLVFRYFLIWIIVGIPFGTKFIFNFIHMGVTIPSIIGIIAINLFLGGLIGGFIAVWRLFVAISDLVKALILIKQIMN